MRTNILAIDNLVEAQARLQNTLDARAANDDPAIDDALLDEQFILHRRLDKRREEFAAWLES